MGMIKGFSRKSLESNARAEKASGASPMQAHAKALDVARKARSTNPLKPVKRLPQGKSKKCT